jgi:hypothetical protein
MKIFWDFDGTLYEFRQGIGPDIYAQEGYSRGLNPVSESIVPALSMLSKMTDLNGEKVEHYLLSAVMNMDYVVSDKKWAIKHDNFPIPEENMIFVSYGHSKAEAIKAAGVSINKGDLFVDDYTTNLFDMDGTMTCVKMLNGINDTRKTWTGSRISAFSSPQTIVRDLLGISYMATCEDLAA